MLALILALAPYPSVPQEADGPAWLHPSGALLYAETPDVADVLIAYEDAPLAQMIRDAEVRSSITELLATTEFDLQALLADFATKNEIPPELLAAPLDLLTTYLSGVESTSLSVSFHEDAPGEFQGALARMLESYHKIGLLREHLTTYASQNFNQYPSDLSGLDADEALLKDGWGRPYEYQVNSNASAFELRSLGADGERGGVGEAGDLESDQSLKNALRDEAVGRAGATAIIEFSSGATANQAHALLSQVASEAPIRLVQPDSSSTGLTGANASGGGVLNTYELTSSPRLPGWTLLHESRLVVGVGASTSAGYFERLGGAGTSLASSPEYARMIEGSSATSGAVLTRGYLAVSDLVDSAQELAAVLEEDWNLQLGSAATSTWSMVLEGERFTTDIYSSFDESAEELARSVGCEPMSQDLWALVPEDAIIVGTASVDAQLFYAAIMRSLGETGWQERVPSALNDMEERYGFNLEDDLFGSIGSGVAFYMLPVKGVMSVPAMALLVELDDPEVFRKGLEGFLALLGDKGAGEYVIKYRPYRDHPMWYFTFSQSGGSPIPISPSLVIYEDHLIVTLTNLRAKKEIKRLGLEPTGLHQLFTSGLPADATAAGYMDWSSFVDGVYTSARAMLSLLGGGGELPFDITALPEPETFTSFFQPTVAWAERDRDGLHMRISSSFGPETFGALAGVGLAGFAVGEAMTSTPEQTQVGHVPLGGADSAGGIVQHERTLEVEVSHEEPPAPPTDETLGFLSTRLAIYRLEKGRYPATLEDLTGATENYPRGFLGADELPLDEWGQALSYSVAEDGSKFQLWSVGPDGVDQQGGGDDLVPR